MADSPIILILAQHRKRYFPRPSDEETRVSDANCETQGGYKDESATVIECDSLEELHKVVNNFMAEELV
jgi:hypothetical protein